MNQMNKVVSLVERDGKVRAFHVASVTRQKWPLFEQILAKLLRAAK